jgi:2-polyprenyl-3-methyl-5-hydroxy-6-metoxy-1,4-benzoquinol methylase
MPVLHRTYWNANTHYHRTVIAALPSGAQRVLDVGCGDGLLAADLVTAGVAHVVALDADGAVLERARARHPCHVIEWRHGDVLTTALDAGSFDAVVSVAALHHMDAARAMTRFAHLVRPGGVVVVVGLAATTVWDAPLAAVAVVAQRVFGVVYGRWEHSAPQCWPPPLTYCEIQALSARLLPGARCRRHLLGRYSLVWRRPEDPA